MKFLGFFQLDSINSSTDPSESLFGKCANSDWGSKAILLYEKPDNTTCSHAYADNQTFVNDGRRLARMSVRARLLSLPRDPMIWLEKG